MGYIQAILTGLLAGMLFKSLNLPIPAPPTIEGILGIIGIFLGYIIIKGA